MQPDDAIGEEGFLVPSDSDSSWTEGYPVPLNLSFEGYPCHFYPEYTSDSDSEATRTTTTSEGCSSQIRESALETSSTMETETPVADDPTTPDRQAVEGSAPNTDIACEVCAMDLLGIPCPEDLMCNCPDEVRSASTILTNTTGVPSVSAFGAMSFVSTLINGSNATQWNAALEHVRQRNKRKSLSQTARSSTDSMDIIREEDEAMRGTPIETTQEYSCCGNDWDVNELDNLDNTITIDQTQEPTVVQVSASDNTPTETGIQKTTVIPGIEFDRPRCQCECGCRQQPGRLIQCCVCGNGVGPGCDCGCLLWEGTDNGGCHVCFQQHPSDNRPTEFIPAEDILAEQGLQLQRPNIFQPPAPPPDTEEQALAPGGSGGAPGLQMHMDDLTYFPGILVLKDHVKNVRLQPPPPPQGPPPDTASWQSWRRDGIPGPPPRPSSAQTLGKVGMLLATSEYTSYRASSASASGDTSASSNTTSHGTT